LFAGEIIISRAGIAALRGWIAADEIVSEKSSALFVNSANNIDSYPGSRGIEEPRGRANLKAAPGRRSMRASLRFIVASNFPILSSYFANDAEP